MYSDISGYAPQTWQWIVSGASVVVGLILVCTGVGGPLGGALIGAGINSIASGYINEASGGSFNEGYILGAITGFMSGLTSGIGGNILHNALSQNSINVGRTFLGLGVSFVGGVTAGVAGDYIGSLMYGHNFSFGSSVANNLIYGALNTVSCLGAAFSTHLAIYGKISQQFMLKASAGLLAFSIEGMYDTSVYAINTVYDKISSTIGVVRRMYTYENRWR